MVFPSEYLAASSKMDKSAKENDFKDPFLKVWDVEFTTLQFQWSNIFHWNKFRFVSDSITITFLPFVCFGTYQWTGNWFASWTPIFSTRCVTHVTSTHFISINCHVDSLQIHNFKKFTIFQKKSWCVYYENITDNGSHWDNPKSLLKQNRTFFHKFLWNQNCQKQNNSKPFSLYVLF